MSKIRKAVTVFVKGIFLFLPFLEIPQYVLGQTGYAIFRLMFIFAVLAMLISIFRVGKIKKKHIIWSLIPPLPYYGILLSTLLNGNLSSVPIVARMIVGIIIFSLYYVSRGEEKHKETICEILSAFGLAVILNILSFFIFYPSMDKNAKYFYLLGVDNGSIYETEFFVLLLLYYSSKYLNKIPKIVYAVIVFMITGYIYVFSGNGIFFSVCLLLIAIFYKKIPLKLVQILVGAYALITVLVVIQGDSSILTPLLEAFGKDPTITGRTDIWNRSLEYFRMEPLFGQGFEPYNETVAKIGINRSHNICVQMLYSGGACALCLLIAVLARIAIASFKTRMENKEKNILLLGITIMLYTSIVDFYPYRYTVFLLLSIIFIELSIHEKGRKRHEN